MEKVKEQLRKASKAYYKGEPIMSDTEFDKLAEISGFNEVGTSTQKNRFNHAFRMYSLQKVFENEHTEKNPLKNYKEKITWTPKLDGAAVSLLYINGELERALTRGDGKKGIDITGHMKHLVPDTLNRNVYNYCVPLTQITGEVVAPSSIKNARNYAAGALNLKDYGEFVNRDIRFIAYGVEPLTVGSYHKELCGLGGTGFDTIIDSDWLEYPSDGMVCRIDDQIAYTERGWTSHHPRGAYALKRIQKGVETTLIDVVWDTGKSGVVAPVAILDPIEIDGAKISKATLHNMAYIEGLNLEIGCRVEVIRSGEIIPKIVRRIY